MLLEPFRRIGSKDDCIVSDHPAGVQVKCCARTASIPNLSAYVGLNNRLKLRPITMTQISQSAPDLLNADEALDTELESSLDPLVVRMKNEHRLTKLRASLRADANIVMRTSPLARVMRRDWNIVSAKLFLNALDPTYQAQIRRDLDELHWQVDDLWDQVKHLPTEGFDTNWMLPRQLSLQVVHPLTASWLRAFRRFDECFGTLLVAEKGALITRRQRFAFLAPVQLAYFSFKATAMNLPLKTTDELLNEAGI